MEGTTAKLVKSSGKKDSVGNDERPAGSLGPARNNKPQKGWREKKQARQRKGSGDASRKVPPGGVLEPRSGPKPSNGEGRKPGGEGASDADILRRLKEVLLNERTPKYPKRSGSNSARSNDSGGRGWRGRGNPRSRPG